MNREDRKKVNHIMKMTDKQFDVWISNASDEDISTALELTRRHRQELLDKKTRDDLSQDQYALADAQEVISRIMKK